PGRLQSAVFGCRTVSNACPGPVSVWRIHPPRRKHHGTVRLQRSLRPGRRHGPATLVAAASVRDGSMTVAIHDGAIHVLNLRTRMPFRYGIATMTETPH